MKPSTPETKIHPPGVEDLDGLVHQPKYESSRVHVSNVGSNALGLPTVPGSEAASDQSSTSNMDDTVKMSNM